MSDTCHTCWANTWASCGANTWIRPYEHIANTWIRRHQLIVVYWYGRPSTNFMGNITTISKLHIVRNIVCTILLIVAGGLLYFFKGTPTPAPKIVWGVTFSKPYATYLGLDWKATYLSILKDLHVKNIRIAIPWNDVETTEGNYAFDDYVFMVKEARKYNVSVIPVLGERVPRWPECHTPEWARDISNASREKAILKLIEYEVGALKKFDNIELWQIENEPFVKFFGNCPKFREDFLEREIAVVKHIDGRGIMITDSGELGLWSNAAKHADVLGVTMYRWVFNTWFNYVKYPFPPMLYARKAQLVKHKGKGIRVVGSELQMEPWLRGTSIFDTPLSEQNITMNIEQFRENIAFARATGFDEHYLWGVEWWYFMKEKHSDATFLNEAKKLWYVEESL